MSATTGVAAILLVFLVGKKASEGSPAENRLLLNG